MKYELTAINIYPVKSLQGISLSSSVITDRGLEHDRRWLIVDEYGKFVTQRSHPELALFDVSLDNENIVLSHRIKNVKPMTVAGYDANKKCDVIIWDDICTAYETEKTINDWLSDILKFRCRLVYMPDETKRPVDKKYASNNEMVSFADAYPFLIIGEQSLSDLNSKMEKPVPMNRFRPNFVFSGGKAYDEDGWNKFKIGEVIFSAPKPCSRCVFTTVDQKTGIRGEEPIKTLSSYRRVNNLVMFGQNLLCENAGVVKVGDIIEVIENKDKPLYE